MNREALEKGGIDYASGLLYFAGKEQIYLKYLSKFREDTHARDALSAYGRGERREVLEQVHALKGLSGTLGFAKLFEKASSVVLDLRSGNYDNIGTQLEEIEREQCRLLRVMEEEDI